MNTTTTLQHTPASSDVDASITTRCVQYLTAVARDAIDDSRTLDKDTLAKTVVKALSDAHAHIRLKNAIELAIRTTPHNDLVMEEPGPYSADPRRNQTRLGRSGGSEKI
ncbi:hypothetical protein [Haloquadratum walsbyi]|nr:hypothetical protein [Haloquadratum walsbyi]